MGGSIPFSATLAADGRISRLELTMPGTAGIWIVELGDYGTSQPGPPPPPAEVRTPSPAALTLLGRALES